MKEWIKENLFGLAIILSIIIATILIVAFSVWIEKSEKNYKNSEEYKQLLIQQENCEHEWVTVSKGSGRTLQVYTKCVKCKKEVH